MSELKETLITPNEKSRDHGPGFSASPKDLE
jgi:hypothetical protein